MAAMLKGNYLLKETMNAPKPCRKTMRLKAFSYNTAGAYFLTICSADKRCIFSTIHVGEGLAPPVVALTKYGNIAKTQLMALEERFEQVEIDSYVIMPNHIHLILLLHDAGGASPSPTVSDIIAAFKSLTTRECKRYGMEEKVFQRSFYDHIIRSQQDYDTKKRYILENPQRWLGDALYTENFTDKPLI